MNDKNDMERFKKAIANLTPETMEQLKSYMMYLKSLEEGSGNNEKCKKAD